MKVGDRIEIVGMVAELLKGDGLPITGKIINKEKTLFQVKMDNGRTRFIPISSPCYKLMNHIAKYRKNKLQSKIKL